MHISNHRVSAQRTDQVFKFIIRDEAVTQATVTILAEDLNAAWNRIHALFPGSDLSNTEVQCAGQH